MLQNQNFDFLKMALSRVLTLADYRSRRVMPESSGIIDLHNNRVCKQFKHWNYRISVPMSYITFLHSSICLQNVCFPQKLINYWPRMYAEVCFPGCSKIMYKSYVWHWDGNSILSVFCHHGYVFVFRINNPGRNQKRKTCTIIWQCQKTI